MKMERLEPIHSGPIEPGQCDWCGTKIRRGLTYCSPNHRVAYNNLLARQGKTLMQMMKHWRKHRGRKGTPGEGKIGDIATRVDAILEEDRNRKKELG